VNLKDATERRDQIENNFAQNKTEGWNLHRFNAIDVNYVTQNKIPGKLSSAQKASSLSQINIIKQNKDSNKPIMIVEDDTYFGVKSCFLITQFTALMAQKEWDLLYLDCTIPDPEQMVKLARLRMNLQRTNGMQLLDLQDINYAGAMSYVVNPKSLKKLDAYFDAKKDYNVSLDLMFRNLVRAKKLKAFATFPFLTCSSDLSMQSSIQVQKTDNEAAHSNDDLWYAFRKLIWNERDINQVCPLIANIDTAMNTPETRLYGQLIAACMSDGFAKK
jgi:hypothetical protein